ncbi:MAG: 4Fe-4S dicluster domain-containing protein [Moorellales bacterium]
MAVWIDARSCNACGVCVEICPEDILAFAGEEVRVVRPEECWYCGSCMMDCPTGAIAVEFPAHMRPIILRGGTT